MCTKRLFLFWFSSRSSRSGSDCTNFSSSASPPSSSDSRMLLRRNEAPSNVFRTLVKAAAPLFFHMKLRRFFISFILSSSSSLSLSSVSFSSSSTMLSDRPVASSSVFFFSPSPMRFRTLVMAALPIFAQRFSRFREDFFSASSSSSSVPLPSFASFAKTESSGLFASLSFLMVAMRAVPKLFSMIDLTFLTVSDSSSFLTGFSLSSSPSFPSSLASSASSFPSFSPSASFSFSLSSSSSSLSSSRMSLPHRDDTCFSIRLSLRMRFFLFSSVSFLVVSRCNHVLSAFGSPVAPLPPAAVPVTVSGFGFRRLRRGDRRKLLGRPGRCGDVVVDDSTTCFGGGGAFFRKACWRSFHAGTRSPALALAMGAGDDSSGLTDRMLSSPNSVRLS
mmetsp:Transcript_7439/g.18248  ORF Transcript_7439/g.18248 Transcript_7439/m.18248 type:complete len:390 (+) Transcript_7439:246-1415(+)